MSMNANVQFGSGAKLEEAYRGSHGCPKGFSRESPEKPMWLDHLAKCKIDETSPMSFSRFVLSLSRVRTSYWNSELRWTTKSPVPPCLLSMLISDT